MSFRKPIYAYFLLGPLSDQSIVVAYAAWQQDLQTELEKNALRKLMWFGRRKVLGSYACMHMNEKKYCAIKWNLSLYSLYHAKAPTGNTAPFQEMSQQWRAVGNTAALDFNRHEIWTSDLPLQGRTLYRSTSWPFYTVVFTMQLSKKSTTINSVSKKISSASI